MQRMEVALTTLIYCAVIIHYVSGLLAREKEGKVEVRSEDKMVRFLASYVSMGMLLLYGIISEVGWTNDRHMLN